MTLQIEKLLWLIIIPILFGTIAFPFLIGSQMLDIHISDTYYIVPTGRLMLVLLIYLLFIFYLYHLFRRKNRPVAGWLGWLHVVGTIVTIMLFFGFAINSRSFLPMRYVGVSGTSIFYQVEYIVILQVFGLLQFIFFAYIIIRQFRSKIQGSG